MKNIFLYLLIVIASSCTKEGSDELVIKSKTILVDASHDGGVWWFPQGGGIFNPDLPHQGKKLADLLRAKGFEVDEIPRGQVIDANLFSKYDKVIRAGCYGAYSSTELDAYRGLLSRPSSLLLAGEFLRPGMRDPIAELVGLQLAGAATGNVSKFEVHDITTGALPFQYMAGSVVINLENRNIVPLAWLDASAYADLNGNGRFDVGEPAGAAVMGIVKHAKAKIFFIGDINGIEFTPQPLTNGVIAWMFE